MENEKLVSVMKDCAQLVDSIHVAGNDRQKATMVVQALMQTVQDLMKEQNGGKDNDQLSDTPLKSS